MIMQLIKKQSLLTLRIYLLYFIIFKYRLNKSNQINTLYHYIFYSSTINKEIIKIQQEKQYQNLFAIFCLLFNSIYIIYLWFNYQQLELYLLGFYIIIFQLIILCCLYSYDLYLKNKIANFYMKLI